MTKASSDPSPSDPPPHAIQEVEWHLLLVREPQGDTDVTSAGSWLFIDRLGRFEAGLGNAFKGRFDVTAERLISRGAHSTMVLHRGVQGLVSEVGGRVLRSSPRWTVDGAEATVLHEATGTALLLVARRRRPGELLP